MAGFYLNFIVNKSQDIIKDTHNERVAEKAENHYKRNYLC